MRLDLCCKACIICSHACCWPLLHIMCLFCFKAICTLNLQCGGNPYRALLLLLGRHAMPQEFVFFQGCVWPCPPLPHFFQLLPQSPRLCHTESDSVSAIFGVPHLLNRKSVKKNECFCPMLTQPPESSRVSRPSLILFFKPTFSIFTTSCVHAVAG